MESFGEYLRRLRKKKGLSLSQVQKAGVASRGYVCKIEKNLKRVPHSSVLARFATLYDVPLKELLIAAGYLSHEYTDQDTAKKIEAAFEYICKDCRMPFDRSHGSLNLTIEVKKFVVQMYGKLTGRNLLGG